MEFEEYQRQVVDNRKAYVDLLKHLSILGLGSLTLMAGFLPFLLQHTIDTSLLLITVLAFMTCIILSLGSNIAIVSRLNVPFINKWRVGGMLAGVWFSVGAFVVGLTTLVLFLMSVLWADQ